MIDIHMDIKDQSKNRAEVSGTAKELTVETAYAVVGMYQSMKQTDSKGALAFKHTLGTVLRADSETWDIPINHTTIDLSKLKKK